MLVLGWVLGISFTDSALFAQDNFESSDPDFSNGATDSSTQPSKNNQTSLNHPQSANKWRTRDLILTSKLPSFELLKKCEDEIAALAKESLNEESLLTARNALTHEIVTNPPLYHWCFYVSVNHMDLRLDSTDVKISFLQKYQRFVSDMKALWILGRALDLSLRSKKYFAYLRRRYIDISQEYFGKNLTPISKPLGDTDRRTQTLMQRPAGSEFSDF